MKISLLSVLLLSVVSSAGHADLKLGDTVAVTRVYKKGVVTSDPSGKRVGVTLAGESKEVKFWNDEIAPAVSGTCGDSGFCINSTVYETLTWSGNPKPVTITGIFYAGGAENAPYAYLYEIKNENGSTRITNYGYLRN